MIKNKGFSHNAYKGDEPHLFASYAHTDTDRVERVLRYLFDQGFRIWYDQRGDGIEVSENWHEAIMERLDHSCCFISFISNGIELRKYVMEEIIKAIEKNEADPNYRIIFIFLEKVSPEVFPEKIQNVMRKRQFIELRKYGGITAGFLRRLLNAGWPEAIIDEELRKLNGMPCWNPEQLDEAEIRDDVDELFAKSIYVYPQAEYSAEEAETDGKKWKFYQISPEQMDARTVYPISMDNQWVPTKLLSEERFLKGGLLDEKVKAEVQKEQREDIFRGLLHNWQILVNRASLLNSPIFCGWYTSEQVEEREAFASLVQCGAIAVFLMGEKRPDEKPRFAIDQDTYEKWRAFCLHTPVFCLRMDWENEQSNRYEMDRLLGYSFQNFCLRAASDRYFLKSMAEIFQIPEEEEEEFCNVWRAVQTDVLAWIEERKKDGGSGKHLNWTTYTRNRFYESFLIDKSKHTVNEGILAPEKNKFVLQLKQIIDFRYSMGLPEALHIQPLIPKDCRLGISALSEGVPGGNQREINEDEVVFSILEFRPDFLTEEVRYAVKPSLSLAEVARLRELPAWRSYMNAVTGGQRRAKLDELYLDDIKAVWERYQTWMQSAKKEFPELIWGRAEGCVSVIYRIGEAEIITVYHCGADKPVVRAEKDIAKWENLKRKTSLTVDYVCGNILEEKQVSCLLTEIRLFEGVTHRSGAEMYQSILRVQERVQ